MTQAAGDRSREKTVACGLTLNEPGDHHSPLDLRAGDTGAIPDDSDDTKKTNDQQSGVKHGDIFGRSLNGRPPCKKTLPAVVTQCLWHGVNVPGRVSLSALWATRRRNHAPITYSQTEFRLFGIGICRPESQATHCHRLPHVRRSVPHPNSDCEIPLYFQFVFNRGLDVKCPQARQATEERTRL